MFVIYIYNIIIKMIKELSIFFATSFISIITFVYLGMAFKKHGRPSEIPYELFPIFLPILYGLFGVINYKIISKYKNVNYSLFVGALLGITLSFIGRFMLNLPTKIFDFTKKNEYKVHMYAIVIYALIFRFIVTPLTHNKN
jgi:hypothetical protein